MQNVPHPVFGIDNLGNRQMMQPGGEYQFQGDEVFEVPAMKEGGIPQRYKNMGFTRVGQKKTGDGQHKWKVLAKKGDSYKVVQGGYRGMQDFKQHHSQERRDRFWDRMGGRDSAKAKDPFSPLYWHKRFGTWEYGGAVPSSEMYKDGGMIKRADGSYSQRGLWDNIRANAGSGKKPTKEMLQQERKIKAAEKKEYGGWLDQYQGGGIATIDNPIYRGTVAGQQVSSETQYPMSKREIDEIARERKEKEQAQKIKAKIESSGRGQRTIYPYTKKELNELYYKNATAAQRYDQNTWQDNVREQVGELPFPSNMLAYPAVATANLSQFPNYYFNDFNDLGQREEGMINTAMAPVKVAMDVAADVAALAPIAPMATSVGRGAGRIISGRIGRNITRATEDLYKLNPEVINPIQPAVAGDFHEYADYFKKVNAEDTKLINLLNANKINIDEYNSQIRLYEQQMANKLGLGKKLGQGNYGAVYESSDPSKVIKLGAPYKEEWTPELIENLKSVKNHGNIAIPEKVETFKTSPAFEGDEYRTRQVIVMPNLNKVGEKIKLNKRDRYALFLKQARQLRDKGIALDAYNPANFQVNYDKGIIDIYDINPVSKLGPHYMHWVKNKTKQQLLDNVFYKNGGWLNQYQDGGDVSDQSTLEKVANVVGDKLGNLGVSAWRSMGNFIADKMPDTYTQQERENIFNTYRPVKYPGYLGAAKEYVKGVFGQSDLPLKDPQGDYNIGEEAWRKALDLPIKEKYITESKYKPTNAKDPNAKYYTLNDVIDQEKLIQAAKRKGMSPGAVYQMEALTPYIKKEFMDRVKFIDTDPLQKFQLSVDPKGKYVSIYDKYDFDFAPANKVIKPYEFYDRFYLPKEKKKIKEYGGWLNKHK